MPSDSELVERYRTFMKMYNESLPADMSDADREAAIHVALSEQVEKDMMAETVQAEEDMQDIYHNALLDQEKIDKLIGNQDQVTAIKAGL